MKIRKLVNNLRLGEGCIWDEKREQVHFVDIEGYKIYSYTVVTDEITEIDMGDYVGCIVLEEDGNLVAGVRNQLIRIDKERGKKEILLQFPFSDKIRFNDGKSDAYGNLWLGTMAIKQSEPGAQGAGSLYCVKGKEIISEYGGFTIANGLDWSSGGDKFYHIDTPTQKIDVYNIGKEGELFCKKTLITVPKEEGSPDGMCMDAKGNLWVAMWGGSRVNCYQAETGEKVREIRFPDKNVSCCVCGGKHLDELYVTTAQDEDGCGGGLYVVFMEESIGKPAYRLR